MSAFLSGVAFGTVLVGAVFVLFITRAKHPRREPIEWTPEFHEPPPPPVTTRILVNRRSIEL